MEYIVAIILAILGPFVFFCPKMIFDIVESWKSSASSEPSKFYIIQCKICGVILFLVGVVGGIILILN